MSKCVIAVCYRGDKLCLHGLLIVTASLQCGNRATLRSRKLAEYVKLPTCTRSDIVCLCGSPVVAADATFGIDSQRRKIGQFGRHQSRLCRFNAQTRHVEVGVPFKPDLNQRLEFPICKHLPP